MDDDREGLGPTRQLAAFYAGAGTIALPDAVWHEAERTLVNFVGCAIGGTGHPAVVAAWNAIEPFAGAAQATLLGRPERTDALSAALLNGIASHVLDFDDTHEATLIHPGGPVLAAAAALAEWRETSGEALLRATVLGVDAACRIGQAVLPSHYAMGWHITGSAGVFGAAVAAGSLLGLDAEGLSWALGLAATQPTGLREMFGSMTKSFHPGRAAQSGLLAALLAERGYTSSLSALEAKRGWAAAVSRDWAPVPLIEGLGERWEIMGNTYKPFACGLVVHPVIDGCLTLRDQYGFDPAHVTGVALRVHPLVLELTGKRAPQTGLDGKFSVYHAAAVALRTGQAGETSFSDAAVQDAKTIALRARVTAEVDEALVPEAAIVRVALADGRVLEERVAHARGSLEWPLSDAALDAKFLELARLRLPPERAAALLHACRNLRGAVAGDVLRQAQSGITTSDVA